MLKLQKGPYILKILQLGPCWPILSNLVYVFRVVWSIQYFQYLKQIRIQFQMKFQIGTHNLWQLPKYPYTCYYLQICPYELPFCHCKQFCPSFGFKHAINKFIKFRQYWNYLVHIQPYFSNQPQYHTNIYISSHCMRTNTSRPWIGITTCNLGNIKGATQTSSKSRPMF